jgi:hypothetical protein
MGSVPFVASSQVQTNKSESKKYSMKFSKKLKFIYIYIFTSSKPCRTLFIKHTINSKNLQSIRKKKGIIIILPKSINFFVTSYDGDQ